MKKLKDVDSADSLVRLGAMAALGPALIIGGALGFFLSRNGAPGWIVILTPFVVAILVYLSVRLIVGQSGTAAGVLHAPSGSSTPHKKEYSRAETLAVRGQFEEAITAFELAIAEDPTDPQPYLRIARIYRDHLKRWDDAARWFRKAMREAEIPPGLVTLARKELIELYMDKMGEPARAAPELARMAEEAAGTPEGDWAARELKAVKEGMAAPEDSPPEV